MKHHFQFVQDLKGQLGSTNRGGGWPSSAAGLDQLCTHLLHAADLSNPCRPFGLARRWAERVLEEFFAQGDRERAEGLPVSPLCARDGTLMAASQIGFIGFVVLPYFKAPSPPSFAARLRASAHRPAYVPFAPPASLASSDGPGGALPRRVARFRPVCKASQGDIDNGLCGCDLSAPM